MKYLKNLLGTLAITGLLLCGATENFAQEGAKEFVVKTYEYSLQNSVYLVLDSVPFTSDLLNINEVELIGDGKTGSELELHVTVFNINFLRDSLLVSASVFPEPENGRPAWERINMDTVGADMININELKNRAQDAIRSEDSARQEGPFGVPPVPSKSMRYRIIVKRGGKWYVNSTPCSVEIFSIKQRSKKLAGGDKVYEFNLSAPSLAYKLYRGLLSMSVELADQYYDTPSRVPRTETLLSQQGELYDHSYYYFWSHGNIIIDGGEAVQHMFRPNETILRYKYIPAIGLVGASYDYYMLELELRMLRDSGIRGISEYYRYYRMMEEIMYKAHTINGVEYTDSLQRN